MHRIPNAVRILPLLMAVLFSSQQLGAFTWPHQSSDLRPDPALIYGELANGVGYVLRRASEPPGRVSVRLVVQAGSLMEEDDEQGIAHYLEHMAFNGTRGFPAGDMIEYFQRLGMAFGADTNASTGFDRTQYRLELPSGDAALREESLQLLRDYADGILFAQEQVDKERGIILAEKVSRDTVDYRSYVAEMEFLFPDARFPERMPIGTEEVIRELDREDFLAFYEQWYHPERTFLVVTGDIDPATWEEAIRQAFATFGEDRGSGPADPELGEVDFAGLRAKVHREPEARAVQFDIVSGRPIPEETDSRARRLRELRQQLASSLLSRRLEKLAREPDSPLLSSYAYTYPFFNFAELNALNVTVDPADWEAGVGVAEEELRRALAHGFGPAEVAEAKARLLQRAREKVAGAPTRRADEWANEYASLLNSGRVPLSPEDDLALVETVVEESTPESLQAVLREAWSGGRRLFLSGPLPPEVDNGTLLATYETAAARTVAAPDFREERTFPYRAAATAAPLEAIQREDPAVHQLVYANGVRVNALPTDYEEDRVLVGLRVGDGSLSLPEDQPGLARLAEGAFLEGGLGELSYDELTTLLAGKSVDTQLQVRESSLFFRGETRLEDLALQLELLRAFLLDPGYREDALAFFRRSLASDYRELQSTWRGVLESEVNPFLYGDRGPWRFPSEEELAARTFGELQAWLQPQLESGYLELSIVGDFDWEETRPLLDRIFGSLPGERPAALPMPEDGGPHFPAGADRLFPVDSEIPQGLAMVVLRSGGIRPVEESRERSLLASVLRDRIRREIREESGQAYAYHAANNPNRVYDFGLFTGLAVLAPELVDPVAPRLLDLVRSLDSDPVSEDERERALAPALKQIEDMRRTNRYWMTVVDGSQGHPAQLEWSRTLLEGYRSIGVEDLRETARQLLRDSEPTVVRVRTEADSGEEDKKVARLEIPGDA